MSKQFRAGFEKLRSPKRLALLEVERVVDLSLEGADLKSVLDVGTGTGLFAEAFSPSVEKVVGIDTNPEMLGVAKEYLPTAKFLEGSAEIMPAKDNEYDLVFLGHVLHESDTPLDVLVEAKRVAKKRVAILEWPYEDGKMGPSLDERMDPDDVAEMAKEVGFGKVEVIFLSQMVFYRFTL
jgi:SAM-dependent methyltransferase